MRFIELEGETLKMLVGYKAFLDLIDRNLIPLISF